MYVTNVLYYRQANKLHESWWQSNHFVWFCSTEKIDCFNHVCQSFSFEDPTAEPFFLSEIYADILSEIISWVILVDDDFSVKNSVRRRIPELEKLQVIGTKMSKSYSEENVVNVLFLSQASKLST